MPTLTDKNIYEKTVSTMIHKILKISEEKVCMMKTILTALLLGPIPVSCFGQSFSEFLHANLPERALENQERASQIRILAERGDNSAQVELGDIYRDGRGVTQDYSEAVRWYRSAAETGNARAQNNLGNMYFDGLGVPQDYSEAIRWFHSSATQKNADATASVGYMYHHGLGTLQDLDRAVRFYQLGSEYGADWVQVYLGDMYRDGQGVAQDNASAMNWYSQAAIRGNEDALIELVSVSRLEAELGNAEAQFTFADLLSEGAGIQQDSNAAVNWYRLAAEQGHAQAQLRLGKKYFHGVGVPQNYFLSHMWLNISGALGNPEASEWRRIVALEMSAGDVAKAQSRAKQCMESSFQGCE